MSVTAAQMRSATVHVTGPSPVRVVLPNGAVVDVARVVPMGDGAGTTELWLHLDAPAAAPDVVRSTAVEPRANGTPAGNMSHFTPGLYERGSGT